MKIEKINDRQICCVISSEDLANNQLKLSELAFGSAKAKMFFRDLMMKARQTCGFDGLNSPLMIEAVPQPPDSLKLIITKMNGPKPQMNEEGEEDMPEKAPRLDLHFQGVDGVLNLIRDLREGKTPEKAAPAGAPAENPFGAAAEQAGREKQKEPRFDGTVIEAFRFSDLDSVIQAAIALKNVYDGENSLYTETAQDTYLLTLRCTTETPEEFNKYCNVLTEYAIPVHCSESGEYYLKEHGNELIADNALQVLADF